MRRRIAPPTTVSPAPWSNRAQLHRTYEIVTELEVRDAIPVDGPETTRRAEPPPPTSAGKATGWQRGEMAQERRHRRPNLNRSLLSGRS